jgi:hypothetical protein
MLAPNKAYCNSGEFTLIIFDLRIRGSTERLHGERAAWQEHADVEMLDLNHAVLIVWPGAAGRLAT